MKTLGIIGGIGPESTIEYYRLLIARYRHERRDGSYPPIIINSINLKKIVDLVTEDRLGELVTFLVSEIQKLTRAGADFGLIAANTPHIVFDEVREQSPIPLISIVRATCDAAESLKLTRLGLFGTRFTMRAGFYQKELSLKGISVALPAPDEQSYLHNIYMNELLNNIFLAETRNTLLKIIDRLVDDDNIQGLILGGTELPLIMREVKHPRVPFLDTTQIHVERAVLELVKENS